MASIGPLCSTCECLKNTTEAVAWCSSCNETLCKKCLEPHEISESTCNHKVITIEDYLELPAFVQHIQLYCSQHHQKYEAFCCNHGHPLCKQCIVINKDCRDVRPLSDIVDNAKSSVAYDLLKDCLNDITLNIQKIKKDQESNLRKIGEQHIALKLEISRARETIVQHLDAIEEHILCELSAAADVDRNRIEKILTELYAKEKELVEMRESMALINENASNFQVYFATKEMEDFVSKADQHLDSVLLHGNCSLQLNVEKNLENLLANISEFGKVTRVTVPSSVKMVRSKDKQAQITRSTNELNVSLIPKLTIEVGRGLGKRSRGTTGCCFHSNSNARYIFAEYVNTQLIIHNDHGKCANFRPLKEFPAFDVAFVNDQYVALTSGSDKKIKTINVLGNKISSETIETSENCYGITKHKGKLLCCVEGKGIELIDVQSKSRSLVITNNVCGIPMGSYITSNDDRVCISNRNTNSMAVFSSDFNKLWEYQFLHTLESPRGVAFDNNNRVYVVGNLTNNVVLLSSNGRHMKEILNESDGLHQPCGICYDRSKNVLLVANMSGTAFLYECN